MLFSSSEAAFRKELAYLPDIFPFLVSVVGLKVPSLVSLAALEARRCLLHREPVSAQRGQDAKLRSEPSQGRNHSSRVRERLEGGWTTRAGWVGGC